MEVLENYYLSE